MQDNKIGRYANQREYFKELNYLAKLFDRPMWELGILRDTVDGELWIMIEDHWHGDLDDWFYMCMETNATKEVWIYGDYRDLDFK